MTSYRSALSSAQNRLNAAIAPIRSLIPHSGEIGTIERDGYDSVRNLLTNFHADLSKFKNVQLCYKLKDSLNLGGLNNHIPEELGTHLFLTRLSKERWQGNNPDRLRLTNSIKFHWLAVSKQ